jgi:hypothetical protein
MNGCRLGHSGATAYYATLCAPALLLSRTYSDLVLQKSTGTAVPGWLCDGHHSSAAPRTKSLQLHHRFWSYEPHQRLQLDRARFLATLASSANALLIPLRPIKVVLYFQLSSAQPYDAEASTRPTRRTSLADMA